MGGRARLNLVLLAVAAALGLLILLLPDPRGRAPAPTVALDPARVERIAVQFPRGGEAFELRRDSAGWQVTAPRVLRASDGRVTRLLESLRAPARSCYAAAEHPPAQFGLEPPRAIVTIDGVLIALGDRATDGRRYLRTGGSLCLVDDVALPILRGGTGSLTAADGGGD